MWGADGAVLQAVHLSHWPRLTWGSHGSSLALNEWPGVFTATTATDGAGAGRAGAGGAGGQAAAAAVVVELGLSNLSLTGERMTAAERCFFGRLVVWPRCWQLVVGAAGTVKSQKY